MTRQNLLKTFKECEYPEAFLVARLQGKKGGLFCNWDFLVSGTDAEMLRDSPFYPYLKRYAAPGIWHFLSNEYQWVYARMNPHLRNVFQPYFIYHEINTLYKCLRNLYNRKNLEVVSGQLHNSLLHDEIQKILTSNADFNELVEKLEYFLCLHSKLFQGLQKHFEEKGFQHLEAFLLDRFLNYILLTARNLQLRAFFRDIIDFHNCMALAKNLRWQSEPTQTLIAGGVIPAANFKRAYFRKDMQPVLKMLNINDHPDSDSSTTVLETTMLYLITKKLKRNSYLRSGVGIILFYLWEQFRYCRNISIILNTTQADDELIRERIVA